MKALALAVLLVALLPGRSAAQEEHATALHLTLVAFSAAQGADLATTMFALGSRRGVEANTIFAGLSNHPAAFGTLKMGVAAATAWSLVHLHRSHPKIAWGLAIFGTAAYSAAATHNARLGRGAQ